MTRIISTLTWVSRLATGAAFLVLMAAVTIQVLGRAGIFESPVWTEELTRFALLYLAAFGAGLSYRNGDLVNVDLVSESLPGGWPRRMRLVAAIATALLCLMLLMPAWAYMSIGVMQTSPALEWRMDFIHVSILILLGSLLVFSLARAISMLLGRSDGRPAHQTGEPQ